VARRIAHEMKNPLTPISLCAERIARQIERLTLPAEARRILGECSSTISQEVESVRTLVDEFSRFARFPAAQRAPADLNEVVENALLVFAGRLDGIQVYKQLSPGLPQVNIDREQFKRVVVNLVDNAAEAMQESPLKRLLIATQPGSAESVDLVIADTGCGISPEDREKLFLPYFSTKGRGTGLGLAIVHHILAEHEAQIRVEDNQPAGVRFLVEIPAIAASETEATVTVQSST
jgi:nitrogen fixation/metabolism regulation signal transduction histidine kinase